jgi:hypothetical protein
MRKKKDTATPRLIPLSEAVSAGLLPSVPTEHLLALVRDAFPEATPEEAFELLGLSMQMVYGEPEHPDQTTREILMEIARLKANGHAKGVISRAVQACYGITNQDPRYTKLCHSATMARKRYPKTLAAFVKRLSKPLK